MQPQSIATPTPPSAMTAAVSMARFLARHPQFAASPQLHWQPMADGELRVDMTPLDPAGVPLMTDLALALGLNLSVYSYTSSRSGPVVSLRIDGVYDGAHWMTHVTVSVEAYAEFVASQSMVVAA